LTFIISPALQVEYYLDYLLYFQLQQRILTTRMMLIQFTGLSGAGKSTIAHLVKINMQKEQYKAEVIDADIYRPVLCPDLGFSKQDRIENIRRLGFIANLLANNGIITILAAINPYEAVRKEIAESGRQVKTIWIRCDLEVLIKRDTKGLYSKALLPYGHPDKIYNLTGVNDVYEEPSSPDLVINTESENIRISVKKVVDFIREQITHSKNTGSL
jgi:adenylylsulfate kinase